jgi:hypothetical protein
MARNGSGVYSLASGNPVVTGSTISSTWANNTLNDIASALTQSWSVDGQTPVQANIPMANFKFTGLGAGTTAGDSLAYGQALNGSSLVLTGGFTGTTATLTGALTGTTAAFSGAVTGVTPTIGDSSTKYATTAFVAATALISALPGQAGNSGKILMTDGGSPGTAAWTSIFDVPEFWLNA